MNAQSKVVRKPSEIVQEMIEERDDISENKLQNEVCKRLMPLEEEQGFRVIAIPNGGKRRAREAKQMKNRGLRAGFPDLMILAGTDIKRGTPIIFIELKVGKGTTSDEQKEWHTWLNDMLFPVFVCCSVGSVLTVLRSHGLRV